MQSNIVSWLCMRQHLPVIPLKLDGSSAVQEGKLNKSQWAQERRAPNLAQTECERSKSHGAKRGKHQILKEQKGTRNDSCAPRNASTRSSCIVLHKHPGSGSSLWIIPPGYLNANRCPSLEACWSIPVQKQFKSILIVHMIWFLCEDPIHSKEVEMVSRHLQRCDLYISDFSSPTWHLVIVVFSPSLSPSPHIFKHFEDLVYSLG